MFYVETFAPVATRIVDDYCLQSHEKNRHALHRTGEKGTRDGRDNARAWTKAGSVQAQQCRIVHEVEPYHSALLARKKFSSLIAVGVVLVAAPVSAMAATMLKCELKPVDRKDYSVPLTAAQLAAIKAAFPAGVCDYRKGAAARAPDVWLSYERRD